MVRRTQGEIDRSIDHAYAQHEDEWLRTQGPARQHCNSEKDSLRMYGQVTGTTADRIIARCGAGEGEMRGAERLKRKTTERVIQLKTGFSQLLTRVGR